MSDTQNAINAFKEGKPLDQVERQSGETPTSSSVVGGDSSLTIDSGTKGGSSADYLLNDDGVINADDPSVKEESASEDNQSLPSEQENSTEEDAEAQPSSEADSEEDKKGQENVEFVSVKDQNGRRRKIKIDYSDKDSVKKAFQLAAGARKWQAERDKAQKELEAAKEAKENLSFLEKVYKEQGVAGVVDALSDEDGAYDREIQRRIEEAEFKKNATPSELEAFEREQQLRKQQQENERLRQEQEEFFRKQEEAQEQAAIAALESRINPVFDRYRFSGKLGDTQTEELFDELLWERSLKNLEAYGDDYDPTPADIQREFRKVSSLLQKRINVQADSKAEKLVKNKKRSATKNAQVAAQKGYKGNNASEEAKKMIEKGDLTSLLRNWGTYGNVFNKK